MKQAAFAVAILLAGTSLTCSSRGTAVGPTPSAGNTPAPVSAALSADTAFRPPALPDCPSGEQRDDAVQLRIVFVIDRSRSTEVAAGADINGDGVAKNGSCPGFLGFLRRECASPGDSVLDAQLEAVRTLLRQLNPATIHAGIVFFGGDDNPDTPDAELRVAPTCSYAAVDAALDEISRLGPEGRTNYLDAMLVAMKALSRPEPRSEPKPEPEPEPKPESGPERLIFFMTDGMPTLPLGQSMYQNRRLAISAAERAGELGIRVFTFGIGPEAMAEPIVLEEMARKSGGRFTPVKQPKNLRLRFEEFATLGLPEGSALPRPDGDLPK